MEFGDQIELIQEYIEDSQEFLNELESLFLQLEQYVDAEPDLEIVSEILSILHTFKGNSGMMGFTSIQKYAHKMEDLFKEIQSGSLTPDEQIAEFVMGCVSVMRNAISAVSTDGPSNPDLREEIFIIEEFISLKEANGSIEPDIIKEKHIDRVKTRAEKTNVLKVDFQKLDNLLNLVGELVIVRTRLERIDGQISEIFADRGFTKELNETSEQLGKGIAELHEAIMQVRMLPVKHVFTRFPRLVRDLAKDNGKEINLQVEGKETELDKSVIDRIGEPLMHLLRNAVDHGIEKPSEREAAGKNRQGNIWIDASQESSHIIITVEDDGRGINLEKIGQKARDMNLLDKSEITEKELVDLIFIPGLSTVEKISEVSGRGIGMDVVKKSLAGIGGSIDIESEQNVGTKFTLKLPLTLAIIPVLQVEVSGERYAVPSSAVIESMRVSGNEIHTVNNVEIINLRDEILPLARLSDFFELPRHDNGRFTYVIVVKSSTGKMGIVADSLLGRQEIVVKALDDYLGDAKGVAGATIMGNGKVMLILDVPAMMDEVGVKTVYRETGEIRNA